MIKIRFNDIFLIPLILLFFPAFCVWILVKPIVIYYITAICAFIIAFVFFNGFLSSKLKLLYNLSALKNYKNFALWCILSGIILVIFSDYNIKVFLYYIITLLLICYTFTYLLPGLMYDEKSYNIKFFIKLLTVIYYIIFVIALLEFFGKTFNISYLTWFSQFLGNQNLYKLNYIEVERVRSIFAEPGWLGGFIFINMPIIYGIILSKYRTFKNVYIDSFIKITMIPLMWFTIIVEQSAIWLVFNLILTIIYFRRNIADIIKRYFLIVIFAGIILCGIVSSIFLLKNNFNIGLYERIFLFFQNITNFDDLVTTNHSLGCRLVSYLLSIKVGLKHWLLGVGLGNLQFIIPQYYSDSALPYVSELQYNFMKDYMIGRMHYNSAIPYEFFAELGVIGLGLFYWFIFKTIKILNSVKDSFDEIENDFLNGLYISLIALPVIIFYDIPVAYYYIWFMLGLSNLFLLKKQFLNVNNKEQQE